MSDGNGADVGGFTVGAVARRLGIPVSTLRSWNRRYELGPSPHRPGGHRLYTRADVAVVERMVELLRAGMSPAGAAQAARAVSMLGDVDSVLDAARRLDSVELLTILTAHFADHGVVATWNRLCRPAFAAIVGLQERAGGFVDVEHLLSWAIATSLHRLIPAPRLDAGQLPIVLACTAGEEHALPLEALRAALAERGIVAVLLGRSLPDGALADALSRHEHRPVVVLWSQSSTSAERVSIEVARSHAASVVLAGPGWFDGAVPAGVRHVNSLEEAIEHVSRIASA